MCELSLHVKEKCLTLFRLQNMLIISEPFNKKQKKIKYINKLCARHSYSFKKKEKYILTAIYSLVQLVAWIIGSKMLNKLQVWSVLFALVTVLLTCCTHMEDFFMCVSVNCFGCCPCLWFCKWSCHCFFSHRKYHLVLGSQITYIPTVKNLLGFMVNLFKCMFMINS